MRLEPLLLFLAFLLLDVSGMAPGITFGDSGELAAAGANLSVAHAPGYPLHALLAKAFGSAFPWGGWAYRTNLLTAVLTAACLAVLASALRLAGLSRLSRIGAVLFLGLCGLWRHSSSVTEVFGLHLLALSAAAWVVCRFPDRLWEPRPAAAVGLCLGLGLANHHTLVLALPAVLWQAWQRRPSGTKLWPGLAAGLILGCCGMACYLYLPIRSLADPPLDWGDPTTIERFIAVLLRKDYGSFALTVDGGASASRWSQVPRYLGFTFKELGAPASALALIGLAGWRRLATPVTLGFPVLLAVLAGPFFLFLGNPPFDSQTSYALERFFLASWVGAAFLVACGLQTLSELSPRAAAALLAVPLVSAGLGLRSWSMRWDLAAYDYGRNILKTLPEKASLFMDGGDDTFYSLAYLTQAQAMRPDLRLADRGGLVFRSPYGPDFRGLSRADKEGRRLAVETPLAEAGALFYSTLKDALLPGYALAPVGLLRKPARSGGLLPPDPWDFYSLRYSEPLLERHYRHRALVALYPVMTAARLAAQGKTLQAMSELSLARSLGPDVPWLKPVVGRQLEVLGFDAVQRKDWVSAEAAYAAVCELDPGHLKAWRNLGAVYWNQARWRPAAEALAKASGLAPEDRELAGLAASAARRAGP
ncbi:MAG: DUF2723 domain-containing protein [Elusimicrobia bacterium]|nr:DUF2723 domain-containing protein [Elusimicrobiota bacterium]